MVMLIGLLAGPARAQDTGVQGSYDGRTLAGGSAIHDPEGLTTGDLVLGLTQDIDVSATEPPALLVSAFFVAGCGGGETQARQAAFSVPLDGYARVDFAGAVHHGFYVEMHASITQQSAGGTLRVQFDPPGGGHCDTGEVAWVARSGQPTGGTVARAPEGPGPWYGGIDAINPLLPDVATPMVGLVVQRVDAGVQAMWHAQISCTTRHGGLRDQYLMQSPVMALAANGDFRSTEHWTQRYRNGRLRFDVTVVGRFNPLQGLHVGRGRTAVTLTWMPKKGHRIRCGTAGIFHLYEPAAGAP